ncbi:hypothetical protein Trydic_g18010 [Trypoxylus dichotomus]
MDGKKPQNPLRKRKHDKERIPTITVHPHGYNLPAECSNSPARPSYSVHIPFYTGEKHVGNSRCNDVPYSVVSGASLSRMSDGKQTCNNVQVIRCSVLNNDQRMPCNDHSAMNCEMQPACSISSNNQIPILSITDDYYDDEVVPNDMASKIKAANIDPGNNTANGMAATEADTLVEENLDEENINQSLEKLEELIRNRQQRGWEDAEDAFGRAIGLMLKKVQNIRDRLKIQAKIYETLAEQFKPTRG